MAASIRFSPGITGGTTSAVHRSPSPTAAPYLSGSLGSCRSMPMLGRSMQAPLPLLSTYGVSPSMASPIAHALESASRAPLGERGGAWPQDGAFAPARLRGEQSGSSISGSMRRSPSPSALLVGGPGWMPFPQTTQPAAAPSSTLAPIAAESPSSPLLVARSPRDTEPFFGPFSTPPAGPPFGSASFPRLPRPGAAVAPSLVTSLGQHGPILSRSSVQRPVMSGTRLVPSDVMLLPPPRSMATGLSSIGSSAAVSAAEQSVASLRSGTTLYDVSASPISQSRNVGSVGQKVSGTAQLPEHLRSNRFLLRGDGAPKADDDSRRTRAVQARSCSPGARKQRPSCQATGGGAGSAGVSEEDGLTQCGFRLSGFSTPTRGPCGVPSTLAAPALSQHSYSSRAVAPVSIGAPSASAFSSQPPPGRTPSRGAAPAEDACRRRTVGGSTIAGKSPSWWLDCLNEENSDVQRFVSAGPVATQSRIGASSSLEGPVGGSFSAQSLAAPRRMPSYPLPTTHAPERWAGVREPALGSRARTPSEDVGSLRDPVLSPVPSLRAQMSMINGMSEFAPRLAECVNAPATVFSGSPLPYDPGSHSFAANERSVHGTDADFHSNVVRAESTGRTTLVAEDVAFKAIDSPVRTPRLDSPPSQPPPVPGQNWDPIPAPPVQTNTDQVEVARQNLPSILTTGTPYSAIRLRRNEPATSEEQKQQSARKSPSGKRTLNLTPKRSSAPLQKRADPPSSPSSRAVPSSTPQRGPSSASPASSAPQSESGAGNTQIGREVGDGSVFTEGALAEAQPAVVGMFRTLKGNQVDIREAGGHNILVSGFGCDWSGVVVKGEVVILGFNATGVLLPTGDIQFSDGGYWTAERNMHGADTCDPATSSLPDSQEQRSGGASCQGTVACQGTSEFASGEHDEVTPAKASTVASDAKRFPAFGAGWSQGTSEVTSRFPAFGAGWSHGPSAGTASPESADATAETQNDAEQIVDLGVAASSDAYTPAPLVSQDYFTPTGASLEPPSLVATAATSRGIKAAMPGVPNQDAQLLIASGAGDGRLLAAVLDGHGHDGHTTSERARQILEYSAARLLSVYAKELPDAFREVFAYMQETLQAEGLGQMCGTTCSVSIIDANAGVVTTAHVGDSTVLLADASGNVLHRSRDHICDDECAKRVDALGGEVRSLQFSGITATRVFAKGESWPGLAMSRALGDVEAQELGVLSEPEISEFRISTGNTLVVASDGVWEKFGLEDVAKYLTEPICWSTDPAHAVVSQALSLWSPDGDIDDITAIVVRMLPPGASTAAVPAG